MVRVTNYSAREFLGMHALWSNVEYELANVLVCGLPTVYGGLGASLA